MSCEHGFDNPDYCSKCEAETLALQEAALSKERFLKLRTAVMGHREDGHVYGFRPCATCAAITEALGEPFGCDLWRSRKPRRADAPPPRTK